MSNIITVGEILVEVMAKDINQRFDQTGEFQGPYPSGAPAIFIDQAAKTGSDAMIISAVGQDGFGNINLDRLSQNGVNIDGIKQLTDLPTGVAFVTYQENGDRDFIFHITNAAAGQINRNYVREEYFNDCDYFHIMGSAVYNQGVQEAIERGMHFAKQKNCKISFDPNVRKEILNNENKKEFLLNILLKSDIIIAGEDEISYLTDIYDEKTAVESLFNQNAEIIIVKRGKDGASLYLKNNDNVLHVPPFKANEVDPTGAGDCFAGTFISCLNQGIDARKAVHLSAIAGAKAVSQQGPMEGNTSLNELLKEYEGFK